MRHTALLVRHSGELDSNNTQIGFASPSPTYATL